MSENIQIDILNNKFAKGKYVNFEVIIMRENGYINASNIILQHNKKVQRLIDKGITTDEKKKKFSGWSRGKGNKKYIKFLANKLDVDVENLIIEEESGKIEFLGSYIHPKLIVDFINFVNFEFKYRIQEIVDKYVSQETREIIEKQKNAIKEKKEKIDNLQSIIERLESKIELNNSVVNKKLDKTTKKIKEFKKENKELHKKSHVQLKQIKYACKDRVLSPSNNKHDNIFAIFKKNIDCDDQYIYKNKNGKKVKIINPDYYEYIVIRTKRCNYNNRKKQLKEEYENLELILYLEDIPNANKFYHYSIEKLSEYIDVFSLHFNIDYNYEEDKVIKEFKLAHKDRFDIPNLYDSDIETDSDIESDSD